MQRPRFVSALTGLRFFAAMMVVLFHSGAGFAKSAGLPMPVWNLLLNGYVGVSIFFVLSGFILYYNYCSNISEFNVWRFFASRFARIYPVYLLSLALAFPFFGTYLTPSQAISVLLMVQSWVPFSSPSSFMWLMQAWTISVEMFFYLLFPVFLAVIIRMNFPVVLFSLFCISGLIIYCGIAFGVPGRIGDVFLGKFNVIVPLFRLPEFLFGMMLCRLYQFMRIELNSKIVISMLQFISAMSFIVIVVFFDSASWISFAVVLIGIFMFLLMFEGGIFSKLLANPVLVFLGGASYAIYLLNGPVRAICGQFLPDMAARILSTPLTIATASIVFVAYEQPMRRWILGMTRRKAQA